MSTLAEIESAVVQLENEDQWTLLAWLQERLAGRDSTNALEAQDKETWLAELDELRQRTSTGKPTASVQRLMDELRGDY